MNMPTSSPVRRIVASALNLIFGTLPVGVPSALYNAPELGCPVLKNVLFLNILSIVMLVMQVAVVYYMQGSPGYVFVGLRVEAQGGTRPELRSVMVRSVPYLAAFLIAKIMATVIGNSELFGIFSVLLMVPLVFMLVSGCVLMINREYSLLDRLSKTRVVKAYSINPRNDSMA